MFFALWPDPAARVALAALSRDAAGRAQGRAPTPENLHLTLAFLGDVALPRIVALRAIGLAVASAAAPFRLTLDQAGTFRDAGIAWAGATVMPPELERLVQLLSGALANEGFRTERRAFHAHVTLARRCRRPAGVDIAAPITWNVERLMLNVSDTLPGGPRYRALADWPLNGGAPER